MDLSVVWFLVCVLLYCLFCGGGGLIGVDVMDGVRCV